ncbi:MAG: STT3 domain-containing protein [Candidatus Aenigmarchaeota archaeon]|nr:STT3 domain-containing protein [Candidatus Aenigmarchaeota archaeon]
MKFDAKRFVNEYWDLGILLLIVYIGFNIRSINVPDIVADYDPWWYYRHSVTVLKYWFDMPKWDILSFYPPGRPYEVHLGVEYTLVIFYKIISNFVEMTFMQFFIIAPAIISGLSAIPAYIATRYLTKSKISGLFSAFFAVLAPSFIGYSVAGYMDSKAFVVFYSFLSIFSLMFAMKRKDVIGYLTAIIVNLLFIYTWSGGGWYPLIAFLFFIPAVLIFRIFEDIIHNRSLKVNFKPLIEEAKSLVIPFLIIIITINVITQIWLKENILNSILAALGFAGFVPTLLVNISVAELQSINIFSLEGFQRVASSVGFLPTILTLFGLPLLILFKIWRKEKIAFEEIFLFLFALVTFYMILHGVRFALIFSVATSLAAGYVIGNFYNYLKSYRNQFLIAIFFGIILFYSLDLFSNAYVFGEQYSRGYGISENWRDALDWLKQHGNTTTLVATWWDPGHIIAGYTGLKVHADGAHCGPGVCIPYDHNIRIQDMGRIFSTSNEEEAYSILKKYTYLTKEQCDEVKKKYGNMIYDNILKEDPCNVNITKIYFIASNDLIGKYYWLTYFGTGTGRQYVVLPLTGRDNQGNLVYGNGILTLAFKDDKIIPILNIPSQGIFNMVVRKLVFVYQGNQYNFDYSNVTNRIDGLVFTDGTTAIYMDPQTANSMFTKLYFFNGEGLKYFKLVYSNPEVKIFEVDF